MSYLQTDKEPECRITIERPRSASSSGVTRWELNLPAAIQNLTIPQIKKLLTYAFQHDYLPKNEEALLKLRTYLPAYRVRMKNEQDNAYRHITDAKRAFTKADKVYKTFIDLNGKYNGNYV